MEVQPELLEHLEGIFSGRGTPMPATNIKQATLIPSAESVRTQWHRTGLVG